jgi:signal transduction histidine kinase
MRDAGVAVDYAVAGEPRPVPDGVALAAYRTVQEALTNAVKHASGAHASVRIEYAAGELRIEVTDDGAAAPAAGDGGYGLAGLRERLALYGGTLSAGRRLSGGYRVRALLPLGAP